MVGVLKMQKYTNGTEIKYYDNDVDVSKYINLKEYRLMTDEEIDRHENPMKYWTDEQLAEYNRTQMPTLSPIEFDIKLVDAKLYDQVQELIQSDIKLRIAYTRATFFSRTDPFIEQARIALNLTNEQVDEIWTS